MRAVRFDVSREVIERALNLPPTVRLVQINVGTGGDCYEFVVEGHHFPATPNDAQPLKVDPTLSEHRVEWDWRLPS